MWKLIPKPWLIYVAIGAITLAFASGFYTHSKFVAASQLRQTIQKLETASTALAEYRELDKISAKERELSFTVERETLDELTEIRPSGNTPIDAAIIKLLNDKLN